MTPAATPTDEFIEIDGLRLHYLDWPSTRAGAPTLIALHGVTHHAHVWDSFARAMCDEFRVLALDQRGHGESQWASPDRYGHDVMASDLAAFVEALHVERVTVVGHSMGGRAAMQWAARRPAALDRLVIVDAGPDSPPEFQERVRRAILAGNTFESVDAAVAYRAALSASEHADPVELRNFVTWGLAPLPDGALTTRFDRALADRPLTAPQEYWRMLAEIQVPMLLVRGGESPALLRDMAERIANTVPRCSLVEIASAGHSVQIDRPRQFLEAVRAFVGQ